MAWEVDYGPDEGRKSSAGMASTPTVQCMCVTVRSAAHKTHGFPLSVRRWAESGGHTSMSIVSDLGYSIRAFCSLVLPRSLGLSSVIGFSSFCQIFMYMHTYVTKQIYTGMSEI